MMDDPCDTSTFFVKPSNPDTQEVLGDEIPRPHSTFPDRSIQSERHLRRERRDAMEHRQRILQVAESLFARQGVEAVSMHQIAKAAGVGQGTLYRRYAHKGELCMDLLREHHEHLMHNIEVLFAEKRRSSALERLDGVLGYIVAFLEEQGALLSPVTLNEMQKLACNGSSHEAQHEQHTMFYFWLHNLLTGLLYEAVEQGELATLDISFTADAILATLHPMFYRLQRQERGLSPERILQGLRRIYITGVKSWV